MSCCGHHPVPRRTICFLARTRYQQARLPVWWSMDGVAMATVMLMLMLTLMVTAPSGWHRQQHHHQLPETAAPLGMFVQRCLTDHETIVASMW